MTKKDKDATHKHLGSDARLDRLFESLSRYSELKPGVKLTDVLFSTKQLTLSLRIGNVNVGAARLNFANIFAVLLQIVFDNDPDIAHLSDEEATQRARPILQQWEAAKPFLDTLAYMVQHAPAKLDGALRELLLEAREAAIRVDEAEGGRKPPQLPKRVASIRLIEEKRMQKRLAEAHDEYWLRVANAVGQGGLTAKEDVADALGVNPRTLQRWAKSYGGWKAVVKTLESDSKEDKNH